MIISIDGTPVLTIPASKEATFKNAVNEDVLVEEITKWLSQAIDNHYEAHLRNLKSVWDAQLVINGVTTVPIDSGGYVALVISQENYKDKKARDLEAQTQE